MCLVRGQGWVSGRSREPTGGAGPEQSTPQFCQQSPLRSPEAGLGLCVHLRPPSPAPPFSRWREASSSAQGRPGPKCWGCRQQEQDQLP